MPNYSLSEIMSIATADMGRRSDIAASIVSQRVNMAYQQVVNDAEHALLESVATSSTTSGSSKITLPTDFFELVNVSMLWSWSTASSAGTNYATLKRVSTEYANSRGYLPVGTPESYVPYTDSLWLWPSPNSVYTVQIHYRAYPRDLTDLTAVPSVSTPYRYAIVLKTEELLLRYLGNPDAAEAASNAYIDYMSKLKSDEARRASAEARQGVHVVGATMGARRRRGGRFIQDWTRW